MEIPGILTEASGKPLPLRFAIYIPAAPEPGVPESAALEVTAAVRTILCDRFGGVTSYPALGLFKRESGVNQQEEVHVLESFCEVEVWEARGSFLLTLAGVIAAVLEQERVACLINGRMYLIQPDPRVSRPQPSPVDGARLESLVNCLLAAPAR